MKQVLLVLVLLVGSLSQLFAQAPKPVAKTDAQIKREIIQQSIASYSGSCPCPFNADRAGRRCGARSAYSRPGGAAPVCFAEDITQKMVENYRMAAGERRAPVERAAGTTSSRGR
jgi:hypothetical protein